MPPTKRSEFRTIDDCIKIRNSRAVSNRWVIGLLVACCVSLFILVARVCVAHVEKDRMQDVAISRINAHLERLQVIDEKLDKLIEGQVKRP